MLPQVQVIRYVTPLREGGSLPGIVEADDLGTYVAKFHGAGQGPPVLAAEIIAGELARAVGFRVPDMVGLWLDEQLTKYEPDEEVQDLLKASIGLNLGVDFLSGALGIEAARRLVTSEFAARLVWFDALIGNIDRSWRNPNLLMWHHNIWLIDHGASLYFHYRWETAASHVVRPYDATDHVLGGEVRGLAGLRSADAALAPLIDRPLLESILNRVPDEWLMPGASFNTPAEVRTAYADHLLAKVAASAEWLPLITLPEVSS